MARKRALTGRASFRFKVQAMRGTLFKVLEKIVKQSTLLKRLQFLMHEKFPRSIVHQNGSSTEILNLPSCSLFWSRLGPNYLQSP
jgi:hypothetical protein